MHVEYIGKIATYRVARCDDHEMNPLPQYPTIVSFEKTSTAKRTRFRVRLMNTAPVHSIRAWAMHIAAANPALIHDKEKPPALRLRVFDVKPLAVTYSHMA